MLGTGGSGFLGLRGFGFGPMPWQALNARSLTPRFESDISFICKVVVVVVVAVAFVVLLLLWLLLMMVVQGFPTTVIPRNLLVFWIGDFLCVARCSRFPQFFL